VASGFYMSNVNNSVELMVCFEEGD